MPTDYKGYAEHLALRKPSNPAAVKAIMTLLRTGVFEEIEQQPPEIQADLLEAAVKRLMAQTELQEEG